jgi:hypothetical protein
VEPVIDLTKKHNPYVNPKEAFLTSDEPDDLEHCRKIADTARLEGYAALLVPSAAQDGGKNLIIFIDGPPERVELTEGLDRIPLK